MQLRVDVEVWVVTGIRQNFWSVPKSDYVAFASRQCAFCQAEPSGVLYITVVYIIEPIIVRFLLKEQTAAH